MKKKAVKSLSMTPTPTTSQKIYYKVRKIYIKTSKLISLTTYTKKRVV